MFARLRAMFRYYNRTFEPVRMVNACMCLILRLSMRIERQGSVPRSGGFLVAANHRTYIDPFIINAALRRPVRWVGASFMRDIPVIRSLSRLAGTAFISTDGRNSVRDMISLLDWTADNRYIGIFPEGYGPLIDMRPAWPLRDFHRGFAYIAAHSGKPVLPVTIVPLREKVLPYPFPISVRKLIIPHHGLCELESRVVLREVRVVVHPLQAAPVAGASRAELQAFSHKLRDLIAAPLHTAGVFQEQAHAGT